MSGTVGDNFFRSSGVVASSGTEYDDSQIQSNIAVLGFYVAVNGSLVRYNLVDQSIDEYFDTSGVDASASTNEARSDASPYYYYGTTAGSPTVTQDADSTGVDGDYTWYKWTDTGATGSYNNASTQSHIWLVVAGGGGGCPGAASADSGGGGGGGGYRAGTTLSLTGGTAYTITVGAGGTAAPAATGVGGNGGASSIAGTGITTISSAGGGGGRRGGSAATAGGSGGGAGWDGTPGAGNTPAITQYTAAGETTTVQGYAGGTQGNWDNGAGGGGASEVGYPGSTGTGVGGDGGDGITLDIDDGSKTYAGGGGGGRFHAGSPSSGGAGGGGAGGDAGNAGTAGTDGLGGGGGGRGGNNSGTHVGVVGGTGVLVLRRLTNVEVAGGDLTLQSTDVTAETAPSYGELVMLMENGYGTATLNTDIKGYISRDSGANFTQGTLLDEGSWGTNKKILGFHDLDISGQPSGVAMCYKITTHNQSAASKETFIYATSIGWR